MTIWERNACKVNGLIFMRVPDFWSKHCPARTRVALTSVKTKSNQRWAAYHEIDNGQSPSTFRPTKLKFNALPKRQGSRANSIEFDAKRAQRHLLRINSCSAGTTMIKPFFSSREYSMNFRYDFFKIKTINCIKRYETIFSWKINNKLKEI